MIYIWLVVLSLAVAFLFYVVDHLMSAVDELQKLVLDGLKNLNHYTEVLSETTTKLLDIKEGKHICSECGEEMNEGYCIEDGAAYYCSAACLYKNYDRDEYLDMYECGSAYYTDWKNQN